MVQASYVARNSLKSKTSPNYNRSVLRTGSAIKLHCPNSLKSKTSLNYNIQHDCAVYFDCKVREDNGGDLRLYATNLKL